MNFRRTSRHQIQSEFLAELQRECTLNFEPDVAAAMMMEVEAHLAESIQARLELGEAPKIAEINAVAAFERPERFARSMVLVHAGRVTHDRPLFLLGLAFVVWVAFWILIATKGSFWFFEPLGLLVLACSFLERSAMIGAPRWGTLRSLVEGLLIALRNGHQKLRWTVYISLRYSRALNSVAESA